jgi:transposase
MYKKLNSLRKVQLLTNISKSTISRWYHNILPNIHKEKRNLKLPLIINAIELTLKLNPFFTVNDIKLHLKNSCNIDCSYSLIRTIMKKHMNLVYKNPKFIPCPNEKVIKDKTKTFCDDFNLLINKYNIKNIVSIDEVGFSSRVRPLKAWYKKSHINYIKYKPNINSINKSVCSCITSNGNISYKIQNNPYTKITFLDFLKTLNLPKNTIILLDNVSFHHSKIIKNYALSKQWNLLYIPPYSPWFNPIENVFSVIKNHYRKNKDIDLAFKNIKSEIIINCINSSIKKINNNFLVI